MTRLDACAGAKALVVLLVLMYGLEPVPAQAQNVEGQIVASQFGEYQVPTVGTGFSFPPETCQVNGGNRNFPAFTAGIPIKIVDTNPANTEVVTPVAVIVNSGVCAVSMNTSYTHTSFYLTSGTGGLQEALNNGNQRTGAPNTVILNADWYALVAPANPATVIASVHGNSTLSLIDVTTSPYTAYHWNGSQYVSGGTGAAIPATQDALCGTNVAGSARACTPGTDYVAPSTAATGALSGTYAAPGLAPAYLPSNLIVVNVKQYGAVGNGSSHPACTYLGLANLTALQAYNGGIYSFATSCNNQMDWLATQYGVNKLAGAGGTVKLAGGTYVWDQPVILPLMQDACCGNATGVYVVGDGEGGTFIVPSVPDFGANSAMISCGLPTASYSDNGGTGSGRYGNVGACYGGLVDLTFYNPFTSGTVNVTSTTYARGVINVPAPQAGTTGTPIQMDGVVLGGRMYMHRVGAWNFRMGFNLVGDHMTWDQLYGSQNFCGMYWAPESIYLQGDIVMQGHNFINGNTLGGFCVDKDAQFNLYQSGELYTGYQPYGWIKFPGTVDSYLGSGYFPFIAGGTFDQIQAESTGNAVIWDDNMTQSGGGVGLGAAAIQEVSINSLFAIWGTPITSGGRNQYAWIGSGDISGLTLKNPFSCCGSFEQGGSGQIAGILAQYTGAGGGIEIDGDLTDAMYSAYNSMPLVGNTRYGGYCSPVTLHTPGEWDGAETFLDPTVSSITSGQALMVLPDGSAGIANGTGPVIGVAAQSFTNPGTGQCVAYMNKGALASPFALAVPGSSAAGNVIVSTTSGQGAAAGTSGGYVIGTAQNGGTSPNIFLNGLGGYIPGTSASAPFSSTTGVVCNTSTTASGACTTSQVQTAIGSGVYDASGAAATAQTNAESFTSTSYAPLASPAFTGTPTVPTATAGTNTTRAASTAFVAAATASQAATNAANIFTAAQTAPGFFPQAKAAGPYSILFDDYYSGANNASNSIGAPTGASCGVNTTYTDINHPGNLLLTSGTGTGTGITCGYQSENPSVISANSASLGWTWETAVYVPVLPGTTAGSFQGGLTATPAVNPWTTGIQFYLSSANSVTNDWYCRYSSTSTDSTIAAVAASWTRLTLVNDGTYVHWYINGTEATGCKTAVGSMPSSAQFPASWSVTALSSTSVTMAVDYVDFQRATAR